MNKKKYLIFLLIFITTFIFFFNYFTIYKLVSYDYLENRNIKIEEKIIKDIELHHYIIASHHSQTGIIYFWGGPKNIFKLEKQLKNKSIEKVGYFNYILFKDNVIVYE